MQDNTDQIFIKPISSQQFRSQVIDYINKYVTGQKNIVFDYNHYLRLGSIRIENGWFADLVVDNIRKMGYSVQRRSEMSDAQWKIMKSDILAFDYTNRTFDFNLRPQQQPPQPPKIPSLLTMSIPVQRKGENYTKKASTTTTTKTKSTTAGGGGGAKSQLNEELELFLASAVLPNEEYEKRRQMLMDLHNLLNFFGKIHPIGSVLTGLAGPNSDVDVCFADSRGRNKQIVLVEVAALLSTAMVKGKKFCKILNTLSDKKVPTLTFLHHDSKIQCGMYIDENALSIQNSKLLKFLLSSEFHSLSNPLVIFLRHWAHSYQLIGPNGLQSYTIAVLVTIFLVRKNILPSIQLLQSLVPPKMVMVNSGKSGTGPSQSWNVNFCDDFETVKREMARRKIGVGGGVECKNILNFVLEFCDQMISISSEYIVCSLTSEFIPLRSLKQASSPSSPANFLSTKTIQLRLRSRGPKRWIVQDPLDLSVDLMFHCCDDQFARFLLAMQETSAKIRENYCKVKFKELFTPGPLFDTLEIKKEGGEGGGGKNIQKISRERHTPEKPKKGEKSSEEKTNGEKNSVSSTNGGKIIKQEKKVRILKKGEDIQNVLKSSQSEKTTKISSSHKPPPPPPSLSFIIHLDPEYRSTFFSRVTWTTQFEDRLLLKMTRLWYNAFLSFFKDSFGPSLHVCEWTATQLTDGVKYGTRGKGPKRKRNRKKIQKNVGSESKSVEVAEKEGRDEENFFDAQEIPVVSPKKEEGIAEVAAETEEEDETEKILLEKIQAEKEDISLLQNEESLTVQEEVDQNDDRNDEKKDEIPPTENEKTDDDQINIEKEKAESSVSTETPAAAATPSETEEDHYRLLYDRINIRRNLFEDRSIKFQFCLRRPSPETLENGHLQDSSSCDETDKNGHSKPKQQQQPHLNLDAFDQQQQHVFSCEARFQLKQLTPTITVTVSECPLNLDTLTSNEYFFVLNDFASTLENCVRHGFDQFAQDRLDHWLNFNVEKLEKLSL